MHRYTLTLMMSLLVMACSSGKPMTSDGDNTAAIMGKWQLTAIEQNDQNVEIPYEEWKITMDFKTGEKGLVQIQTSCNAGSCNIEVGQGSLNIDKVCPMTKKFCDGARGEWEDKYMGYIWNVKTWKVNGDKLTLSTDEVILSFKRL